jgi:signal transduction histidine kinase
VILNIFTPSGEWVIISSKFTKWDLKKTSKIFHFKWYHTLRWKLFILYFLISVAPLLFFAYNISGTIQSYFADTNEKEALYQANKIAGSIQKAGYLTDPSKKEQFWTEIAEKSNEENIRILVADNNGYIVADTNKTAIDKVYLVPEILVALGGRDEANLRKDEETIYASAYIEDNNSQKIGAVLVISSFSNIFNLVDDINQKLILLTIALAIVVAVSVFFISQLIFVPMKNMLNTIQKISNGQLQNRVEINGYDEFSQLGEAINAMTEKLEQVESSRQEFVSNVSHELKTPLSSIKVLSESILLQDNMPTEVYKEFLQDINNEVDRMTNIVNDLLSLVKLDGQSSAALNIKETDVNKMLREIVKRLNPLAGNKNITLDFEANKEVSIEADEMKLSLAISNLVENGIKYTPGNGKVRVVIDADHQNCFITVQDTGIGISEAEQSKIFDRFYRVDKTRDRETGGTGLGLAITHSTIMLHNGSIKVISSEGEGTTFIVRLPIKHPTV